MPFLLTLARPLWEWLRGCLAFAAAAAASAFVCAAGGRVGRSRKRARRPAG